MSHSSPHDSDDEERLARPQDEDQDEDQDQEEEDEDEDQEEDEEEEEVKVDAAIPRRCTRRSGETIDVPAGVRAAIQTMLRVKPELDVITKACGQVRKKVTAAKKELEKFMNKNEVDLLAFGASKYVRVQKERAKVDLKSIQKSQVLTEKQKQRLIAENTKPSVSFKQE
jgi:hypothetical protein